MHKAVILDLGGVVVDVDFRRVFRSWAKHAGTSTDVFFERWSLDEAYEQHETGDLTFRQYASHLGQTFDVQLPMSHWRRGWNDIFTGTFDSVIPLLHEVRKHTPLHAFTNTNATHEHFWRTRYPELDVFQHIFVSSRIGRRKPNVDAYHYVTDRVGVRPEEVLFLDDNTDNIEGATAAGLDARLVSSEAEVAALLRGWLDSRS